jgi:hypothetical protein
MPADVGKGADEEKDWTYITVEVECKREAEKALLLDAGDGAFWCPRSVISGCEHIDGPGDIGTVTVPRWVMP